MTEPAAPPVTVVSAARLREASGRLGHGDVLRIAVPIMLSNATVPLVGYVDTAVVGQMGTPHLMGGVAVASLVFNMLYWTFSFLRMATTGLTAQALGAGNERGIAGHLLRAVMLAMGFGLAVIVLQVPIRNAALWVTGGSAEVRQAAATYYDIRIWATPAGLVNFALLGWLFGLGRAGTAFAIQLLLNFANIALAIVLGLWLDGGVKGVAVAALIAEYAAAVAGLVVAFFMLRRRGASAPLADALDASELKRSLAMNTDITVRALATFAALTLFTSEGARAGDATLAANALLLSIQSIMIYLLDGFAHAAEAYVGRAVGARDRALFDRAVWLTTVWAFVVAVLVGVLIWVGGAQIIALSARSDEVRATAGSYLAWAALSPVLGVWCFQLDGIFVGATRTRDMRNMMLVSVAGFIVLYLVLVPAFGNHGLWAAFSALYVFRALTLYGRLNVLIRESFPAAGPLSS